MGWDFVLTDLAGVTLGELTNASDRQVSLPHMRLPSASGRLPLDHYLADSLISTDTLLKCYRTDPRTPSNRTLAFHGPVVSAEETGGDEGKSVAFNAAGPFWRLTKRIIPGSKFLAGISYTATDLGQIARNILLDCNGDSHTGIDPNGTITTTINANAGPYLLKNAAEAITELTAGLSSFEYVVTPREAGSPGVGGWPTIGTFNIGALIGATRPDAIFEYGTGRANVANYSRVVTRENMLTRGTISVEGWPDAPPLGGGLIIRTASTLAARGLFEEVVGDAGIIDDTLRTSLVDFHLLYRQNPQQTVTFTPVPNATPSPFTDYIVGDTIRARVVLNEGTPRRIVRLDGMLRIWGMTFNIDNMGNESVELELVAP